MQLNDLQDREYLGDAVYVGHDGYQIWLVTGDGNNQQIALERGLVDRLKDYETRLLKKFAG